MMAEPGSTRACSSPRQFETGDCEVAFDCLPCLALTKAKIKRLTFCRPIERRSEVTSTRIFKDEIEGAERR